jgi:hypothetical protein
MNAIDTVHSPVYVSLKYGTAPPPVKTAEREV